MHGEDLESDIMLAIDFGADQVWTNSCVSVGFPGTELRLAFPDGMQYCEPHRGLNTPRSTAVPCSRKSGFSVPFSGHGKHMGWSRHSVRVAARLLTGVQTPARLSSEQSLAGSLINRSTAMSMRHPASRGRSALLLCPNPCGEARA
jgi:hypothetical protein